MDDFDFKIRGKYGNSFKMKQWVDNMANKTFFLAGWYIDESWLAETDSITACSGDMFAIRTEKLKFFSDFGYGFTPIIDWVKIFSIY